MLQFLGFKTDALDTYKGYETGSVLNVWTFFDKCMGLILRF